MISVAASNEVISMESVGETSMPNSLSMAVTNVTCASESHDSVSPWRTAPKSTSGDRLKTTLKISWSVTSCSSDMMARFEDAMAVSDWWPPARSGVF